LLQTVRSLIGTCKGNGERVAGGKPTERWW